jgi:hypothetical protein
MTINKLAKVLDYAFEQAATSHIPIVVNEVENADDYEAQRAELREMIEELVTEKTRVGEVTWDTCFVIHESNMLGLLNETTYEDYARVYRKRETAGLDPHPTFIEYRREVDKRHSFGLGDKVLQAAYEFVRDLFDDNEKNNTPCDEAARFATSVNELMKMVNKN